MAFDNWKKNIPPFIHEITGDLCALRHDLHANPEIGFNETRTAAAVAEQLARAGCEVHRGIGGTGLVGVLRNGEGPSIGLRADMDALPIQEENAFPYKSIKNGSMHACGHDGHTTMLVGAARYLAKTMRFKGSVNFIFQPAEEGLGGAKAMLGDRLLDRFACRSIYGMHNWPGMAVGKFAIRQGAAMAGGAFFDICLKGRGGHGAFPHLTADPVLAAGQLIVALQRIVSRRCSPIDATVVSVTSMRAGGAHNVIPGEAWLGGTARAFSSDVMALIESEMKNISEGIAAAHGVKASVDFRVLFSPTINAGRETKVIADAAADLVGEGSIDRNFPLVLGSEDFSFMLERCPGAFIMIGNGEKSEPVHTSRYDFNDEVLPLGAALFASVVERELSNS